MIRRVQVSLAEANYGKLSKLSTVMDEAIIVINRLIAEVWTTRDLNKFSKLRVDTWLSARLQQCLLKQAVETVKSQRKKRKPTMPTLRRRTLNLDERFLTYSEDVNSFDFWVRLSSLGNGIRLRVPARKHAHFDRFAEEGWTLRKGGRLRQAGSRWFFDIYFEKAASPAASGSALGVDIGFKKLITCSDGRIADAGLSSVYNKLSRKKQGSKAFKRALTERDQRINTSVNQLDLAGVREIVVEALRNVKHKSKFSKKFNNRLQRWSYPKVLGKLRSVCEVRGITFTEVNPAYTSQTCSLCGHVDKNSRHGEQFLCTRCGMRMDADINAAKNILMRGAYSPPSVEQCHQIPF